MTQLAWAGWQIPVPSTWRPLKIEDTQEKGSLMIGDADQPLVLMQWSRAGSEKGFDPARWLHKRFRKQGLSPDDAPPHPSDFDVVGWACDVAVARAGHKTVWYGYAHKADMILEVSMTDNVGHAIHKRVFHKLLPQLTVSATDAPVAWHLYDTRFASPPGFTLAHRHLYSGDIALQFRHNKEMLLMRQVYPARLALTRRDMNRWILTPPYTERRFWRERERERDGDGQAYQSLRGWKRLRSPLGGCAARYATAMAMLDEPKDRLCIAEYQSPRLHDATRVKQALAAMHSESRTHPDLERYAA